MVWKNLSCVCLYKKFWSQTQIRPSLWLQLSGTSSEMFWFVSNACVNFCETFVIFCHSLHVWYHDKSHDFQTSFALYRILKLSSHTFVVMFHEQDVRFFLWILWQCLKLDSITCISFFHSLYYIIRSTCSSNLNIPKVSFKWKNNYI